MGVYNGGSHRNRNTVFAWRWNPVFITMVDWNGLRGRKCYPFYFTNCFRKQTSLALAILVSPQQELFSILSVIKEMIDILACKKVKLLGTQSCLTLCNPMDYSLPGSSVHGMLQARTLECVAVSSSKRFSQPRDQTRVSCTAGRFFTI